MQQTDGRPAGGWDLGMGPGLRAAHRALREGGVLGVRSIAPDRGFKQRLGEKVFEADELVARVLRTKRGRHTLWLAIRGGAGPKRAPCGL